jgi:hypothetical protein
MPKQKKGGSRFTDLDVVNEVDLTDAERAKFEPNPEATEIVCIVDRSGSMDSIKADAIGGFNAFLKDQQSQPGEAYMTICLFDNEITLLCSGSPINEVKPLDEKTYIPRGSTALLDAIGNTLADLNKRNPKKAIIMILTDGQENASRQYKKQQIKELIEECEKKDWYTAYISASWNSIEDAKSVGIGMGQTMSFRGDSRGANVAYMTQSLAASDYRSRVGHGMSASMPSMATYSARASQQYDTQHNPQKLNVNPVSSNTLNFNQLSNNAGRFNPFTNVKKPSRRKTIR